MCCLGFSKGYVYELFKRAEEGEEGLVQIKVEMPSELVWVSYRGVDRLITELMEAM